MKQKAQLSIGIIALLCLLGYTMIHTGQLLAVYVHPPLVGFVAAFGIEMSVVSLSLRIGELRKSRQNTTFFIFVLVSVVVVSAIANIAQGFETSTGDKLTSDNLSRLDAIQAVIGLSATGLISLIVLALSEIVGTDVSQTIKVVVKEQKEAEKAIETQQRHDTADKARQVIYDKINDRRQTVLSLLSEDLTESDIADKLDVSVRTIQRDILALNGKVATK